MAEKTFKSLEKALDILCLFDTEHPELSAQDISERMNMRSSSTYRYLEVLLQKGFLTKDLGRTKYKLGLRLFRLGNLSGSGIRLVDVSHPYMKKLADSSQESILLTVRNDYESVCLEKIEAPQMIKLSLDRGSSLPLHAAASSRILLAYQDDGFVEELVARRGLVRLTENTITDLKQLKAELNKTRDQGYTISIGEADPGAAAVAAPIFDHKADIAAGLTIAGPTERMQPRIISELSEMVTSAALRISQKLGYEAGK